KEDYEAIIVFAKEQGLAVTATHPNRTLLDVSGSVEAVEKVFHVTMRVYQHPTEARTFHAPEMEPSLDLAVRVLHISGLDSFSRPHSIILRMISDRRRQLSAVATQGPDGRLVGNVIQ